VSDSGQLGKDSSGSAYSFASDEGWSDIMYFECFEPNLEDYDIPDPEDVTFP
jgi:hypothetical protein